MVIVILYLMLYNMYIFNEFEYYITNNMVYKQHINDFNDNINKEILDINNTVINL